MLAKKLNAGWRFSYGVPNNWEGSEREEKVVTLPHDAMILEERTAETLNGCNTGYYPGNLYTYIKNIQIPEEWEEKEIFLEFDGIYHHAKVYINGNLAVQRPYGYSQFSVRINDFIKWNAENEIMVIADTSGEKDSRWYTGGGIYRDVKLYVADRLHVGLHGLHITTPDVSKEYAQIMLDLTIENVDCKRQFARVFCEIRNADGECVNSESIPFTAYGNENVHLRRRLGIVDPRLWSCEDPYLYQCHIKIERNGEIVDEAVSTFGIRKLQLDAEHGLRMNGQVVNLRGACIHHDHGVIGAISLYRAEERKIQQLKDAGFNCIRSSHNPAGPVLLDICDKLGMLVMDETFDMWTNSKCDNDYANHFLEWWERDVEAMVEKDFNHPSVILYSLGNEIDEAGTSRGAYWNQKMADKVRSIDDTRFITNGINGLIIIMDQLERIVPEIMERVESQNPDREGESDTSGSNGLNNLISFTGGITGDMLFQNPLIDERTEEIYGAMDIAGMNYMASRYELDHKKYPNRLILGTETFPADIVRLWSLTKKNPHVIGDMTWTGYDYLGEAGGGIFRYDGSENFGAKWPARASYMGDINLIGIRRPISYLREIVYGMRKEPYISVERLECYGLPASKTPWMLYDDIASWTWPGFEGKSANVRVFSASEEVELFLNGKSMGRKPAGEGEKYTAEFEVNYEPGILMAVGYSGDQEDGRMELATASEKLRFHIETDCSEIKADGEDLAYVTISLVDELGVLNPAIKKEISVSVEGAGILQGFGSANPESEGNYFDTTWETFEGRVMAVIRAMDGPGEICVKVQANGIEASEVKIISVLCD